MKIQNPPLVIPAKAGTQSNLRNKNSFFHLYEMIFFLRVSLGPCLRRDDKLGEHLCEYYVELTLKKWEVILIASLIIASARFASRGDEDE